MSLHQTRTLYCLASQGALRQIYGTELQPPAVGGHMDGYFGLETLPTRKLAPSSSSQIFPRSVLSELLT